MTDPRRQVFAAYLRALADALRLRDWTIRLSDEPAGPGDSADVACPYGRKLATVRLGESFLDDAPEEQRHTLTHELIHCHLMPAWEVACEGLEPAAVAVFRRLAEYGVDGLADAVAPLMPLPGRDE